MSNCTNVSKYFLRTLNIKYTDEFVADTIQSNHNYPSLLTVSDLLNKYNIKNVAIKTENKKLFDLPTPCIVHLSNQGGMFHVLSEVDNNEVNLLDDNGKKIKTTIEDFISKWTGISLIAEVNEFSGEPGYEVRKLAKSKSIAFNSVISIILLASIIYWVVNINVTISNQVFFGYFFLKALGLLLGFGLLWFEIDQFNPTLQNFCAGSKRIDCNAVLNSKYAKLFNGQVSLGLIVFSYFFSSLVILISSVGHYESIGLISIMSLFSLPAILLSIYYQAFKIKHWCKFCVGVQIILLLEIILVLAFRSYYGSISFPSLLLFLGLFLLPVSIWMQLRPLFEFKKEARYFKQKHNRIKHNPDVFFGLLNNATTINHDPNGLGITISNPNAKYHILKVCNPYCGPCSRAHETLHELLEKGRINLQIIFNSSLGNDDYTKEAAMHLLAVANERNNDETLKALDDWYGSSNKNYPDFSKKYALNSDLNNNQSQIEAMWQWCQKERIEKTPTIFINGYMLPEDYSVEDLLEIL